APPARVRGWGGLGVRWGTSQVVGGPGRGGGGLLRAYGVGPTGGGRSGRIRTCGRLHMRELLCRAELRSVRPAGPAATSVAEDGRCCRASCHGPTQSVVEGRRRSPAVISVHSPFLRSGDSSTFLCGG